MPLKLSSYGIKSPNQNMSMSTEPIDIEALAELEDIMEDDFGLLLETYLLDADKKLAELSEALTSGDARAVRELAHSFKGASCNVGALPLSRLCESVEQFAKNEQIAEIPPLLPGIHDEYAQVKTLLQEKIS
jgi:histidine phosphotransfer protein HptB